MATKLTRQTLYQFGSTVNGSSEVGVYGSGATGSPVYTSSITLMQSLAAWGRGWAAETIANNRPFLEDMNAVDCVMGYQMSYMLQQGIPEYDTTGNTFYFVNSIVQSNSLLYQVINDNNGAGISATLPTNLTYWRQFTAPAPYVALSETQSSGTNGQSTVSSGSYLTAILNSKDSDSQGIATLTSNQVTLPAGTYIVRGSMPANQVGNFKIRLFNVTTSSVLLIGSSELSANGANYQTRSTIDGKITLTATSAISLQFRLSGSTGNIGVAASFGDSEIYTMLEFTKVA